MSGLHGGADPADRSSVMHQSLEAKPDVDGEERILVSDVVLELDMKFFREEEYDLITDVYTPIRECVPEGKNEVLERLLVRNFSRCRISDRIQVKETQGKVLQLCHSQGKVKIDKTRIVENGVQADGVVMLKILYIIGNDDMPFLFHGGNDTVFPYGGSKRNPTGQLLSVKSKAGAAFRSHGRWK